MPDRLNPDVHTALRLAAAALVWTVLFLAAMALMACTAPDDNVDPADCREADNAEVCE